MLPTAPVAPDASMAMRITCWPALKLILGVVRVCQICQPPVFGIVIVPVLSTPSNSTWNVPPAPFDATLDCSEYVPAVWTLTVYSSHSPPVIQPTLKPPPVSVVLSRSTFSDGRYTPPLLPTPPS